MTRSDLLIEMEKVRGNISGDVNKDYLLEEMYRKIENAYEILFALEKPTIDDSSTTEKSITSLYNKIGEVMRKALEE